MSDVRTVCDSIRGKSGGALLVLLRQAISSPKIYFYGQLLHAPEVRALQGGENDKYYQLIDTLAFGNFKSFSTLSAEAQELATPAVRTKIRQLSIMQLAATKRRVTYADISDAVGIKEPRELEDLVIDTITEGLLRGRIDQLAGSIEIFDVAARDVHLSELDTMIAKLQQWSADCASTSGKLAGVVTSTANRIETDANKEVAMKKQEEAIMDLAKAIELEQRDHMSELDDPRGGGYSKRNRDFRGGGGWGA